MSQAAVVIGAAVIYVTPEMIFSRRKRISMSNVTVGIMLIIIGIITFSLEVPIAGIINVSLGSFLIIVGLITYVTAKRQYEVAKAQERVQANSNPPDGMDQSQQYYPNQFYPNQSYPNQSYPNQSYPPTPQSNQYNYPPPQPNQFYPPQYSGYDQQGQNPSAYPGQMGAGVDQPLPYSPEPSKGNVPPV